MKNWIVLVVLGICFGQAALAADELRMGAPPTECYEAEIDASGVLSVDIETAEKIDFSEYIFGACILDPGQGYEGVTVCRGLIATTEASEGFKSFEIIINSRKVEGYQLGGISIETRFPGKPFKVSNEGSVPWIWCR